MITLAVIEVLRFIPEAPKSDLTVTLLFFLVLLGFMVYMIYKFEI